MMPVFRSKGNYGRMAFENAVTTPWKRWFAWYPVSDLGVTYWLVSVEWRHVISSGFIADHPLNSSWIDYKLPKEESHAVNT